MKIAQKKLSGWGHSSTVNAAIARPEYRSDCERMIRDTSGPWLAFGCGRSYGDEALNQCGITIDMSHLNRFLEFDAEKAQLICEGGATLHDIQCTLLPRGFGLKTSPGTSLVSVGGAIANDVHGKNHDRVGSFGEHVLWLELLLASGEVMRCSRDNNQALFFATIGGLGLTGIILVDCLQLTKQPIAIRVNNTCFTDIKLLMARLRTTRHQSTYSVAWLDLTRKNKFKSVLSTGEPDYALMSWQTLKARTLPVMSHLFLNRFTITMYNKWHYAKEKKHSKTFLQSLPKFLYPLDQIKNWNNLYGKKGFYQFQCVIPDAAADSGIADIIKTVQASSLTCYLAVLKTLGESSDGYLSFPMCGFTLALDFLKTKAASLLLEKLAAITLVHGGRVYFAKDACLKPEMVPIMYPKLKQFRDVLHQVDPNQRWQSQLASRLRLRGSHE